MRASLLPMSATLGVAAAQAGAVVGDVAANARAAADLILRAAEAEASVVVFPELFLCGYDLGAIRDSPEQMDVTLDDPRLEVIAAACGRAGTAAVVGASLSRAGRRTISALVFDRSGGLRAAYDKIHVDADERGVFATGERLLMLDLDGWRLGIGICYDASFPEHARAAAVAGAHAYLCPSAFFAGDADYRRTVYFAARALENTFYVVFANFAGVVGDAEFCGHSAIFGPDGRRLADAGPEGTTLATARLDAAELTATRESLTMLRDRDGGPVGEPAVVVA